ncbi:hypothetical protein A1O3_09481 [Capronia epimyces CBS 606.96]|uniref:ER-bound oxygenase mpaB/mpaB'/Rubber oxygenase catalytic domain-containing protein n=1 Tax=Capronia epimyces CBS 606.96 TaxID=1182542 RepID=W9XLW4_9EURO|nr:uncharacterized protein A1O3_09481 [Capronia epimyces CBS 606.96]EXJ78320.1 hypothetical protein A1O3_09481 [Capronia epimyces CBS 606.96]
MDSSSTKRLPYHWIRQRIESLDPEKDYEEIWRLSAGYGLTAFTLNLVYAITFPNFIVTEQGSRAVWRSDGGKIVHQATQRVEQTANNNAIWWWYGPHHPLTKKSVNHINRLHDHYSKLFPGDFGHNDDYVYTLTYTAATLHRLKLRLGLPGFTDKEKKAAHLFWREMSKLFRVENRPVRDFPTDWDDLIRYNEEIEANMASGPERATLVAEGCFDQFAFRFFPPGLRWLGRSIPICLSLPTTLKACHIEPVNPILDWLITFVLGSLMWLIQTVLPDPKESYWQQQEKMSRSEKAQELASYRKIDVEFAPWFVQRHKKDTPGCPFHAALGEERMVTQPPKAFDIARGSPEKKE